MPPFPVRALTVSRPLAGRRWYPRAWRWWAPAVLVLALAALRLLTPAGDGLDARYVRGLEDDGAPAMVTVDARPSAAQVRGRWGRDRPEAFTVAWRGYLTVLHPATYQFATTSDDGSQLFIDDRLVVENGGVHAAERRAGVARLTSGPHRVLLRYTQAGGDLQLDWTWSASGEPDRPVPGWLLSRRPAGVAAVRTARVLDVAVVVLAPPALMVALWALARRLAAVAAGWRGRGVPDWAVALRARAAAFTLPGAPAALTPGARRALDRSLRAGAVALPVVFLLHALSFWGHGVIDEEATTFVINYLADRPFLQAILDPNLNDWGSFQARELAYVFDRLDARVFAWLLVDRHVLLFVPLSAVLSLLALAVVYLAGARRVLCLDRTTARLLLALFLSCIVTQASTPVLYRSSKMLLSVAVLAFLFQVAAIVRRRGDEGAAAPGTLVVLFGLGVVMSMCDRQGYAFLLSTTAVLAVLWLRDRLLPPSSDTGRRPYGRAALSAGAATATAVVYNNMLAPYAIHRANGYWPDLSYEDIPFERFTAPLAVAAWEMFRGQVQFFFGNLPFVVVCVLGLVLWAAVGVRVPSRRRGLWRRLTSTGVIVTAATAGALLVLITVMGMRHPPVFRIVDHAYWYYTLSMQAVLLFGATLVLARFLDGASGRAVRYTWIVLIAMMAANAAHYPGQRRVMEASGDWFGKQYAFAQLYAHTFAVDEAGAAPDTRVLPTWMRVEGNAVDVHLPLRPYGLLDAFRAGYATLQRRAPLTDAGGPYWRELRDFLDGTASPFVEPDAAGDGLAALQSVGVRRVVVHRTEFDRPEQATEVIDAARTLGSLVRSVEEQGAETVIAFSDVRRPAVDRRAWSVVPRNAFVLSASPQADAIAAAADGRIETQWDSTMVQDGREWIRIDLDAPTDIAGVRLLVTDQGLDRYPRRLAVESIGPGGSRMLYDGPTLPALAYGLLTRPVDAPIDLAFEANVSRALVLRQTSRSPWWSWAVRELQVYQRRR